MSSIIVEFPGNLAQVDDFGDLRALPSYALTAKDTILVRGGDVFGDSSGGTFAWNPGSTANDNDSSVILPSDRTPLQAGRWISVAPDTGPLVASVVSGTQPISIIDTGRPANNQTRTIVSRVKDFGYDVTSDIEKSRSLGVTDDAIAVNAALAQYQYVCYQPRLGGVTAKQTIKAYLPNTHFKALGGQQGAPIIRDPSCTGSTMRFGDPTNGLGCAAGELDLWFYFAGRNGLLDPTSLSGRLTNGESHVEVWGGQGAKLRIGANGIPVYLANILGGSAIELQSSQIFGGVWDPNVTACQEAIAHYRIARSAVHGNPTNIRIIEPHWYGGNQTSRRPTVVADKTVSVAWNIGPIYHVVIESCEDLEIIGGFMAGASSHGVAVIPQNSADFIQNIKLNGVTIDEQMGYGVYTYRQNSAYPIIGSMIINDCLFNGQIKGLGAINFDGTLPSVSYADVTNCKTRAHLGGAMRCSSGLAPRFLSNQLAGYNCARNDVTVGTQNFGAGLALSGATRLARLRGNQYGGGINSPLDVDGVDPYGLSANGTQLGFVSSIASADCIYSQERALNFGMANSAVATGGTLDNAY